jgi:hypothetical protein
MSQNLKTKSKLEQEILAGLQSTVKGYKLETLQKYAKSIANQVSVSQGEASVNGATGSVKNVLATGVPEKETTSSGNENVAILDDIDYDSYLHTVNVDYHEVGNEFDIFDCHLDCGEAILLEGPKGCGKSLAIAKWCSLRGIPFITFDCSEETKEGQLMGRLVVKGQETPFHLGNIPRIIEICKHFGNAVIIFEELNALTNQMQKLLNPLLDWRKGAYVETISQHFELNEGDKLLVMATMNPSSYSGVNELNDDLLSRFTKYKWEYPTMTEERKLLHTTGVPAEVVKQFLKLGQETRAAENRGDTSHSISTRELDSLFNLYRAFKSRFENPLTELINGKVKGMFNEEEEWNIIKSRIESIFGREVFNVGLKKVSDEDIENQVEGA